MAIICMQSNQTNVDKMYKATSVGNCLLKEAKVLHGDNCNRRQVHACSPKAATS